jgi:hypothetical protein
MRKCAELRPEINTSAGAGINDVPRSNLFPKATRPIETPPGLANLSGMRELRW